MSDWVLVLIRALRHTTWLLSHCRNMHGLVCVQACMTFFFPPSVPEDATPNASWKMDKWDDFHQPKPLNAVVSAIAGVFVWCMGVRVIVVAVGVR